MLKGTENHMLSKKDRIKKIVCIIVAIDAFLGMHVMYVNLTYSFTGYCIQLIWDLATPIVLMYYIFIYKNRFQFSIEKFFIVFFLILYYFYTGINFYDKSSITIRTFIALVKLLLLFLLNKEEILDILYVLTRVFALVLIPCIIINALLTIGVSLPYTLIEPSKDGQIYLYYFNYFGCLFIHESNEYWRLCGIFNEPGVIGTIGGLLLCKEDYQLKRWYNLSIFIACIMSFSTAFFMISIMYIFLKFLLVHPSIKKYFCFLCGISVAAVLDKILCTISMEYLHFFHNKVINLVFYGTSNRSRVDFDNAIKNLWKGFQWIFGLGGGAEDSLFRVSSIKGLFLDFGLVGVFILGIALFSIFISIKKRNIHTIIFFSIYLISLYQRPYTINFFSILILYSSLNFVSHGNENNFSIVIKEIYYKKHILI